MVTGLSISLELACADKFNFACADKQLLQSGLMTGSCSITSLTDDEVRVIDRLRPAVSALFRRFDAELQREQRLSFGDYIVLFFVSQAPDQTLGLSELAARCQQSRSAISRTIGRLKADGLVRREQSPHDARAYNAVLTDFGLARLQWATPLHHSCVRHYLLDQLGGVDLRALGAALERIAAAEDSTSAPAPDWVPHHFSLPCS
jgi:DNA-binding MarR family transcriptional regulator